MMLLLETPARNEIAYRVQDLWDGAAELARRSTRFPDLEERYVKLGVPVVGPSGNELFGWALKPLGLQRSDLFIENVLHCFPPKGKTDSHYPTGPAKKLAEATCQKLWSRIEEFAPTAAVVNFHPAAILRDVTPLPVQIRAFERAKMLMNRGERVIVCCGGHAADFFFGYASNVTRWCGHWQQEDEWTWARRRERWTKGLEVKVGREKKVKKVKKLTVKAALLLLLDEFKIPMETDKFTYGGPPLSRELLETMRALCALKPKKVKL
jgi:hypothetical protein